MSAIPEGAVSSPGLMLDVPGSAGASFCAEVQPSSSGGSISSPLGLSLSDPPRVTEAYGIPAYDPNFGLSARRVDTESQPFFFARSLCVGFVFCFCFCFGLTPHDAEMS